MLRAEVAGGGGDELNASCCSTVERRREEGGAAQRRWQIIKTFPGIFFFIFPLLLQLIINHCLIQAWQSEEQKEKVNELLGELGREGDAAKTDMINNQKLAIRVFKRPPIRGISIWAPTLSGWGEGRWQPGGGGGGSWRLHSYQAHLSRSCNYRGNYCLDWIVITFEESTKVTLVIHHHQYDLFKVSTTTGESIRALVSRLLAKRGLRLTSFDVFSSKVTQIISMNGTMFCQRLLTFWVIVVHK